MISKLTFGWLQSTTEEETPLRKFEKQPPKIDDEIMIECRSCKTKISSRELDDHETDCAKLFLVQNIPKIIAIPTTKIESTELN